MFLVYQSQIFLATYSKIGESVIKGEEEHTAGLGTAPSK